MLEEIDSVGMGEERKHSERSVDTGQHIIESALE